MSAGEIAYLMLVIGAFTLFGIILAAASWYERAGAARAASRPAAHTAASQKGQPRRVA